MGLDMELDLEPAVDLDMALDQGPDRELNPNRYRRLQQEYRAGEDMVANLR